MPRHTREIVVSDCDGRLLAFGVNLKAGVARFDRRVRVFDYFDGLVSALYTAAWLLYSIEWLSGEVIR